MIDKLHLTINSRALKAVENLYSGESIIVEVEDAGLVQLQASDYRLVIFGADKTILAASEPFTASDTKWTATLNTASEAFQFYYSSVSANTSKTLGMMIVNDTTGDTLCAGTVSVTSVPFPTQISSIPNLYADNFLRQSQAVSVATGVFNELGAAKIGKVANAVENNVAVFTNTGEVKDSGLKITRRQSSEHGSSIGIGNVKGIGDHDNALAIGDNNYTEVTGDNAVAVGMNCSAAANSVTVGEESFSEEHSVVVGYASCAEMADSVIVGCDSGVVGDANRGTAIGTEASIDGGDNAVAIGYRAQIDGASNAVQLGTGTNSTAGTLQFRSFPLMNANGRIAKEAVCGQSYYGGSAQNVYTIDGLAILNTYMTRDGRQYVFDYSAMTGDDTAQFFFTYQGYPNAANIIFKTAGIDDEAEATIQECDIVGESVDWQSNKIHQLLFLALVVDNVVGPELYCLAKWVSQRPD